MLKKIIKRDGSIENYDSSKLNKWVLWASNQLGNRVDWTDIVSEVVRGIQEEAIHSQDLQKRLINACLQRREWAYNLMAGRLYAATLRKQMYDEYIPTIRALHTKLYKARMMAKLDYSAHDYQMAESIIQHDRDFEMAHFQIHQIRKKYALQNRTNNTEYETPQFVYIRMAMALAEDEPKAERMNHVKAWYDEFSLSSINAPTPNYVNLGTEHNGYASCCLYTVADSAESLAIGDHIAYTMTYMSAGIGSHLNTRSVGDPVRGGQISHQGKMPYYAALAKANKANMQAGRGGACTAYYSAYDPEAETIMRAQNPRTTEDKKNRDLHFAAQFNAFFAKKVALNEPVFQFTSFTAPDLWEKFFSADIKGFAALYEKYERNPSFKKNYINAREFVIEATKQSYEVATHYFAFMDEINRHTPFTEPIHSSNLCLEIAEPTSAYHHMTDLYHEGDLGYVVFEDSNEEHVRLPYNDKITISNRITFVGTLKAHDTFKHWGQEYTVKKILEKNVPPEVALCSLAALVVSKIDTDEHYERAAYYALKMIDKCIHKSTYKLPHIGYTAKQRMNAGVGMLGVATVLARKGLKYDTEEGRNELHRLAERHMYFLVKASLRIAKERGNAPWIHKTKWANGWLPIDTYKHTVDELVSVGNQYDWETLRQEIIQQGGIGHSCLVAHMPTESSSKASGAPNNIYPVRFTSMKKTDGSNAVDWVAEDSDILEYQLAYDISQIEMIKSYAVIQKFTDHAISADLWKDRTKQIEVSTSDMVDEFIAMAKYGQKTRYYQNSLTSEQDPSEAQDKATCASGACDV